jgi:hypothetical protein
MAKEWTKEQRAAQSKRIKAAWARRKAAQNPVQAQMAWWQRVLNFIGLRK